MTREQLNSVALEAGRLREVADLALRLAGREFSPLSTRITLVQLLEVSGLRELPEGLTFDVRTTAFTVKHPPVPTGLDPLVRAALEGARTAAEESFAAVAAGTAGVDAGDRLTVSRARNRTAEAVDYLRRVLNLGESLIANAQRAAITAAF
jgi:hypothetical protein